MDRKEYWDKSYVDYWKKRVNEANSDNKTSTIVVGDSVTDSDKQYIQAIELLSPQKNKAILEMGCGFGRSLPFLYSISTELTAIDISEDMIVEAKRKYADLEKVNYFVCEAEKTPMSSSSFSYVICYAVFDALYQNSALLEINRLLEISGKALISGKNDNYYDNDDLAYTAEVNARNKNHPNFFTDVNLLLSGAIKEFGFIIEEIRFFERRGDMANDKYLIAKPEFFYEYIIVIKKVEDVQNMDVEISDKYSKFFRKKEILMEKTVL